MELDLVVDNQIHHRSSMGGTIPGVIGGAGPLKQVQKIGRKSRKDRETCKLLDPKKCIAFENTPEASQVLACIIQGIYQNCMQEEVEYVARNEDHWKRLGYKILGFGTLDGTYKEVDEDRRCVGDLGRSKDQCARAVFFERVDSQVSGSYINPSKILNFHFVLCNVIRIVG